MDTLDWTKPGVTTLAKTGRLKSIGNGTIVLMHDGGGDRSADGRGPAQGDRRPARPRVPGPRPAVLLGPGRLGPATRVVGCQKVIPCIGWPTIRPLRSAIGWSR